MSTNKPVMSHDPLADVGQGSGGDAPPGEPRGKLVLDASITIADVAEYHGRLKTYVAQTGSLVVDGSNIEMIDGAGLQLLAAFTRELDKNDCSIQWDGVSDTLRRSAMQMGIDESLHI